MKFYISILLLLLFGCQNSRVEQLEKENAALQAKIDTLEWQNELQYNLAKKAKENADKLRDEAQMETRRLMDSDIVKHNKKVLRINSECVDLDAYRIIISSEDGIEELLKPHDIYILSGWFNECGYEFLHGKEQKVIKGALSEEELIKEIEMFFNINL